MQEFEIIKAIIEQKKKAGQSIEKVFFTACGGSIAAFYPSKFLLETESTQLKRIGYYTSNEFVHATPKSLDQNSLVIACSHQGNTPETVEAVKVAKKHGASTIAFTYQNNSELSQTCDKTIIYQWGPGSEVSEQKPSKGLKVAISILKQLEDWVLYDSFVSEFDKINNVVETAKESITEFSVKFAKENKVEKVIYTIGSGASFGSAYMEDICILKEMQWIHSASIHSGEFFHGPLEITDTETPFLLLLSEGKTRVLDERVLHFLKKYGRKVYVLDVKNLGINVIDESIIDYFSPLLLTNVLGTLNEQLARERKHPLTTRRYMWKVAY